MSHRPPATDAATHSPDCDSIAARLLARIGQELIELSPQFTVDDDLFHVGLDSMAIMQIILIAEEEFSAKIPYCSIKRETFTTARAIAKTILAHHSAT